MKRFITFGKTTLISTFFLFQMLSNSQSFAQLGLSTKFFAEVYNETTNMQREGQNTITMTQSLQGTRTHIPKFCTIDLYIKERFGSDANRDYWNNRGELMLGARVRLLKKVYLGAFYEYIRGKYFGIENNENPNPYGLNYEDMRCGLIFWHGMDREFIDRWTKMIPFSFWDEIYADAIYYKRDDKNYIYYINGRAGIRLIRIYKTVLDIYGVNYFICDKNGDFWNNKFEFGSGIRLKPWTDLDLSIYVEFLRGSFWERDGRYTNPYEPEYTDVRVGVLFWHGWGY